MEQMLNFDAYIRQGEPSSQEAAQTWNTAIGLQAVDGLNTSEYLHQLAYRHIDGEITIDEVRELVKTYYEGKQARTNEDRNVEEADRVSANIVKVLSQPTFAFNANGYISIHRRIFEGVYKHAGRLRDYNITKKEWVLRGDTVNYLNWEDLRRALDYDIQQEKEFDYTQLSIDQFVRHISQFVSGIWQIHAFGEGNTRATAVFTIQYLRYLGFDVDNEMFAKHSWYFRNALVRANYSNYQMKILRDTSFLELFFRNLLMGECNELKNRYLVISAPEGLNATPTRTPTSSADLPFATENVSLVNLVKIIGTEARSIKEMLEGMGLKDRKNFLEYHLMPAIADGYVSPLYPDKPRHPRQKYLLTVKGTLLYNQQKSI